LSNRFFKKDFKKQRSATIHVPSSGMMHREADGRYVIQEEDHRH
jgi:hypothetical protein